MFGGYPNNVLDHREGVWVSGDGVGLIWTLACEGDSGACPWPVGVAGSGQSIGLYVQQANLVGLYDQMTWVAMGGSTWQGLPINTVALSNTMGVTWQSYSAPWAARYFLSASVDADNWVTLHSTDSPSIPPAALPTKDCIHLLDRFVECCVDLGIFHLENRSTFTVELQVG